VRVIVTGSRKWSDLWIITDALLRVYRKHGAFCLVHGDCSTGADHWAHLWWEQTHEITSCTEQRFPANWERGKVAGPERNRRMIEAGADLVLAFPLPEGTGTQHTMQLAREAGIRVIEYNTRGEIVGDEHEPIEDGGNEPEGQDHFEEEDDE